MAKKTFKIGERCKGGIITIETKGKKVAVIGKDWDFSQGSKKSSNQTNAKEWTRLEVDSTLSGSRRQIDNFLNDLTSSYYADKVMDFIESKVEFPQTFGW